MTGWSGLASGRSGWACFRGIENIHGQSLSNVFVSSDPRRPSASRAGPRGYEVALTACRALMFWTRRDYSSNNKMSAKGFLLFVGRLTPLVSLRMPSIGHTDLIQTLFSAAKLSGPC